MTKKTERPYPKERSSLKRSNAGSRVLSRELKTKDTK